MKNRWKQSLIALTLLFGISVVTAPTLPVAAINVFDQCDEGELADSAICQAQGTDSATDMATIIINTLLLVLGIIAVIMIIIGGIRYTTSGGDSSAIKAAKDTILYSVIGLVVAILAFAIVNFILDRF